MRNVAVIGDDLVAVGTHVWTSPDGVNWTRITVIGTDPPSRNVEMWAETRGMEATVVAPGRIVSVDESGEHDVDGEPKLRAVVWTATTRHLPGRKRRAVRQHLSSWVGGSLIDGLDALRCR